MNFIKTIILVIIIAMIIGALIVFLPRFLNQNSETTGPGVTQLNNAQFLPSPTPTKPPVTINESSDLKEEAEKITIPDFKTEFDQLKAELN